MTQHHVSYYCVPFWYIYTRNHGFIYKLWLTLVTLRVQLLWVNIWYTCCSCCTCMHRWQTRHLATASRKCSWRCSWSSRQSTGCVGGLELWINAKWSNSICGWSDELDSHWQLRQVCILHIGHPCSYMCMNTATSWNYQTSQFRLNLLYQTVWITMLIATTLASQRRNKRLVL